MKAKTKKLTVNKSTVCNLDMSINEMLRIYGGVSPTLPHKVKTDGCPTELWSCYCFQTGISECICDTSETCNIVVCMLN